MTKYAAVGVLGTSGVARELFLPALATARNATARAVASRDVARAQDVANQFSVPGATDYDGLLADKDIDAVYISLPNTLHVAWILKALDAGKAVLCEKPLAVDANEAQRVVEKSDQTSLPVMEGLMYRFHPQNIRALELIRSDAIGEVTEVHVRNAFRLVDSMDPDNIRVTDGKGGGALMDMGPYVVSAARLLFGQEPSVARGWIDTDDALGIDVGFSGTLQFPERRFAQVSWSFRTGFGAGYTVVGTRGTIEVPRAFIPGAVGQAPETLVVVVDTASRRRTEELAPANHFRLEIESFSDAVISGTAAPFDARDALGNARALDLIRNTGRADG